MGKKKGSKVETNGDIDDIVAELEGTTAAKKGKKSKKKDSNWEDDVAKEMEEMTLTDNGDNASEQVQEGTAKVETKEKKKKEKKSNVSNSKNNDDSEEEILIKPKKGGGFAALMDDDDDGIDVDMDEEMEKPIEVIEKKSKKDKKKNKPKLEDPEIEDPIPEPPPEEEEEEKVKKGKKKKKGKKANDEEDLDKILEELESEYRGDKPKEKPAALNEEKEDSPEKDEAENVDVEESAKSKKKKKKEAQKAKQVAESENKNSNEDNKTRESSEEPLVTQTQKTIEATQKPHESSPVPIVDEAYEGEEEEEGEDESSKKKKKKKKKKGDKEDEDEKTKKGQPNKKVLAAMKEILAKQKEDEERLEREEAEKLRLEEEKIKEREEAKRLEEERKERRKLKEKERRERLKAEGKLLTNKQKQDLKRAQEMLEHFKSQGIDIPEAGGEKRPKRPKKRPKKNKDESVQNVETSDKLKEDKKELEEKPAEPEAKDSREGEEDEEIKDNWEELSSEEEEEDSQETDSVEHPNKDDDDDDNSEEESSSDEEEHKTEAEKRKVRAVNRIEKRKVDNEKNRSCDLLRAPVVCVLGHVDHGKTKILDKLRNTNVQEGEVGGITQQIGATNVPSDAIKNQCRMVKEFNMDDLKFPGLLIIDTPGHESFSNLRTRGSSLCDIAILVVDITQGLEPQTIESINLLKNKKTPFVVALNKVDRVFEWESHANKDITEVIKLQNEPCKNDFDRRTKETIAALNIQGMNAALFWENPDPRSYVSLVPTSAITGDGMGNLISMICQMCQLRLPTRLMFTEELQCIVLEVKTIQGHGTTIDVILINGRLREGDTIVLAGTEGPITTQIRSLLLPRPMKEIRVKGQYDEFKEISAAQGVKIAARDLEKAIAGLSLQVACHEDEVELLRDHVDREFSNAMRAIKVKDRGVYVQASTLGALEALLEFFKTNKVPYSGIRVGPVVKRDVMKATAMLEHDPVYAVILAFDVKVERDAQELADKEGVKIFSEETIYHLGDRYVDYLKDYKKRKQDEFKHIAVFPSRLKIIPTAIFNKRDPIVIGVTVEAGVLRTGTPLCVPSKEFVEIGIVTSLEFDHKSVDIARKGVDICIKIEPAPGQTPKLFGRHFEEGDMLVSKISRESINACKDHFRDDLNKLEWKLMADLKKEFAIL